MKQFTVPVTVPISPHRQPLQVWQTLLAYLLDKHYELTLYDTPFHDGNIISEHIEAGVSLVDAVHFLVERFELVRIDQRGLTGQDQEPWLTPLDVHRARFKLSMNRA